MTLNHSPLNLDFSQAEQVSDHLKVLSNPDRLKILCVLIQKELHVQQIETSTNIRQPTLSQQLTILRNHHLVGTRRDGKHIFYHISDEKILHLMQTLHQLYCQAP